MQKLFVCFLPLNDYKQFCSTASYSLYLRVADPVHAPPDPYPLAL